MIDRSAYHLLMSTIIHAAAEADGPEQFNAAIERLIITSYEINNPEMGRLETIDVTGDLIEKMGRHWAAFSEVGICKVEFVRFYIEDECILETGRMLGHGDGDMVISTIRGLPVAVLKSFAKAMVQMMRTHDSRILQEIMETGHSNGEDLDLNNALDLSRLIREFLEEEVEETVSKFSQQLDAVFGVAAITDPWPPPRGGEPSDDPFPL